MRKLILAAVLVFGFTAFAQADVFGPTNGKWDNQAQTYQVPEKASAGFAIEPATVFQVVTNVVDYLGSREGTVYNFKAKEWETFTGATLYTWKNISLDIGMLNLDGVGASIDYNLGALLPTKGIPILQYTQYLYVGGGCGGKLNETTNKWEVAPYVGAEFKLTF